MYLSRLILNSRSRHVWRDLADCQQMHRTVMSAFPDSEGEAPRQAFGVLFRLEATGVSGAPELLVQSRIEPDWRHLADDYLQPGAGNPGVKRVAESHAAIDSGQMLRFRLLANPTRKIDTRSGPDGMRRNGKRVELRSEAEALTWLERKASEGGFELLTTRPGGGLVCSTLFQLQTGQRVDPARGAGRRQLTFRPVLFEGILRVTNADRFRVVLTEGVGSAKAYGFGLLSVAPVRAGAGQG